MMKKSSLNYYILMLMAATIVMGGCISLSVSVPIPVKPNKKDSDIEHTEPDNTSDIYYIT